MGLGTDIKSQVDSVRNTLGTDCTLNGTTALGKCAVLEMSPEQVQSLIRQGYEDEIGPPFAMIEVPATPAVKEGDLITVDLTGEDWIVFRKSTAQAAGVVLAQRCLCKGKAAD